jgi:hypothetical protein
VGGARAAYLADAPVQTPRSWSGGATDRPAVLRNRSTTVAMDQATEKVTDRFEGTRIAASVNALLASHHGNTMRGGIVVIGSDGWDSEPPQQLAEAMARLRRRATRVIWINPRVAAPGFEPLVGTMAAALPFCDELLAAHDFRSRADSSRSWAGQFASSTASGSGTDDATPQSVPETSENHRTRECDFFTKDVPLPCSIGARWCLDRFALPLLA